MSCFPSCVWFLNQISIFFTFNEFKEDYTKGMYSKETILDAETNQRQKICDILKAGEEEKKETEKTEKEEMCTINIRPNSKLTEISSDDESIWDRYELV